MISALKGIARILEMEGTAFVSLFPSCNLNNAIGQEGKIPIIMTRDERYGVGMADAFSRLSDGKRFGVCTLQGGVNCAGLEFAAGAIMQAFEDSSPILCFTDGLTASDVENSHFRADRVFSHITRWSTSIPSAKRMPEYMTRAFTFLKTGRPGPVLMQLPNDLGEYDENEFRYERVEQGKSQADPDRVKEVVKALLAAKKPLLLVGEGVFRGDACAELLQFVDVSKMPVMTTLKAKSAFPENHQLSLGMRGEPVEYFLNESDLVFAIGSSLSPNRLSHGIPNSQSKTIIQCTIDNLDINKSYRVKHYLIGDSKLVLRQLTEEFAKQTGGGLKPKKDVLDEIKAAKAKKAEKYGPAQTSNDVPINPYRVYHELQKTLDPMNSLVTHESGNTRDQLTTVYEAIIPHGYMGWGNISTLGFSLAGAMAAKLAFPNRQVVNVTGDAAIGYMLGNIEVPLRHNLGITTIHINNSSFTELGPGFWGPGMAPFTHAVTPSDKTHLAKVVEGMGIYAERVTSPSEIVPAIKRALEENSKNRPAYLEFICAQYPVYGPWIGGRMGKGPSAPKR